MRRWLHVLLAVLLFSHINSLSARESHITSLIRKGIGLKDRSNSASAELERAPLQNQSHHSHHHTELYKDSSQSTEEEDRNSQGFGSRAPYNQSADHQVVQEKTKPLLEPEPEFVGQNPHSGVDRDQTTHRRSERFQADEAVSESTQSLEMLQKEKLPAQEPESEAGRPNAGSLNARLVEEAERLQAEKVETERIAAEKVEAGRLEAERLQAEGLEAKRIHTQQVQGSAVSQDGQEPGNAVEQPAQIKEELSVPLHEPCRELQGVEVKRSRKLDIVIAHYDPQRIESMLRFWLWFFSLEVVKAWQPYVFIYTQSQDEAVIEQLRPFIQCGGDIVRLANAGRESHVYLQHINRHYEDLADHTLFSQDEPNTYLLPKKFERLFVGKTGFLPLSFMGHVDCFESWNNIIPPKVIPQLYGMLTHSLCPPTGYAAGFEGQFIVSKQRILDQPWRLYRHLIDMVAAPSDHWVHEYHQYDTLKDQSNPYMGHALERAWSLAFNCYEVWRQANCYDCEINKDMQACGRDACQCFDV